MKGFKFSAIQIIGLIFAMICLMWAIYFVHFIYCYLFPFSFIHYDFFYYPYWFLIVNMTTGIIGFYISVLLFKNRLKIKYFFSIVVVLFLLCYGTCLLERKIYSEYQLKNSNEYFKETENELNLLIKIVNNTNLTKNEYQENRIKKIFVISKTQ